SIIAASSSTARSSATAESRTSGIPSLLSSRCFSSPTATGASSSSLTLSPKPASRNAPNSLTSTVNAIDLHLRAFGNPLSRLRENHPRLGLHERPHAMRALVGEHPHPLA